MKLKFWRFVMCLAWTCDDFADEFVEWAQQQYANEVYGLRRFE